MLALTENINKQRRQTFEHTGSAKPAVDSAFAFSVSVQRTAQYQGGVSFKAHFVQNRQRSRIGFKLESGFDKGGLLAVFY